MNAAVIVAHPDDEVIWAGGLILRHPDWEWSVLSLCRGDDADRAPKFRRVCKRLGVRGVIEDLDDGNPLLPIDPEREIGGRVLEHLGGVSWELCLTHGANGEYGHERHRQVTGIVRRLVTRGELASVRLWTFAYEASASARACRPAPWADMTIDLTEEQLSEKKRIVREDYGYPEDGFEVRACISPEAFFCVRDVEEDLIL